jgi:hypothetical protein
MKYAVGIFIMAGVIAAGANIQAAAQTIGAPAAPVSRYHGVANLVGPAGATTPLRVEVKDWNFVAGPQTSQVPPQGFYIAQLRSGRIITEIAGKSEKRRAGDFWTVEAGHAMTITFQPHGEAAELRTIEITPGS